MMPGNEGMAKNVAGAPTSENERKFMAVTGQVAIIAASVAPKAVTIMLIHGCMDELFSLPGLRADHTDQVRRYQYQAQHGQEAELETGVPENTGFYCHHDGCLQMTWLPLHCAACPEVRPPGICCP